MRSSSVVRCRLSSRSSPHPSWDFATLLLRDPGSAGSDGVGESDTGAGRKTWYHGRVQRGMIVASLVVLVSGPWTTAPAGETAPALATPPSAEELYLIEAINRYRSAPTVDAERMRLPDSTVIPGVSRPVDLEVFATELAEIDPAPPVLHDARLCRAARNHAAYLATHQVVQHHERPGRAGFTGLGPLPRARVEGWPVGRVAENCTGPSVGLWNSHVAFIIDWARPGRPASDGMQDPRGHRETISGPVYRRVGVGVVPDPQREGRYWVVQLFGRVPDGPRRLGGVVFTDTDRNGLCDPGEGLGGIEIAVTAVDGESRGRTLTWTSGGWGIEDVGPGQLEVIARRSEDGDDEVLAAWRVDDGACPVWLRCVLPPAAAVRDYDAALAAWERVAGHRIPRVRLTALLALRERGRGLALRDERAAAHADAMRTLHKLDAEAAKLPARFLHRYRTGDHAALRRDLRSCIGRYRGTALAEWLAQGELLLESYAGVAAIHSFSRRGGPVLLREIRHQERRARSGRHIAAPRLREHYRDLEHAMQTVSHGPAR